MKPCVNCSAALQNDATDCPECGHTFDTLSSSGNRPRRNGPKLNVEHSLPEMPESKSEAEFFASLILQFFVYAILVVWLLLL